MKFHCYYRDAEADEKCQHICQRSAAANFRRKRFERATMPVIIFFWRFHFNILIMCLVHLVIIIISLRWCWCDERRRRHFLMRASVGGSHLFWRLVRAHSLLLAQREITSILKCQAALFPTQNSRRRLLLYKQPTGNFNSATALQFAWILHKFIFSHFAIKFGFSRTESARLK